MKVAYMMLEPYVARYTYQLFEWNKRQFEKNPDIEFIPIKGTLLDNDQEIKVGSVLDAHGRSFFSVTQTAELIKRLPEFTSKDVIFYEDMFTPGIESLGYILDQLPEEQRPRVYVRCLAQTADPDDFVHRTGMFKWMRKYEEMVAEICKKTKGGILVASEELVANLRIAGIDAPIYVTGLPFGKEEVQSRATPIPWANRKNQVVFAARWDSEKLPAFFCEVAKKVTKLDRRIQFTILTGHKTLKSDRQEHLDLLKNSPIKVREGLQKNEYYEELAQSKLLFNCALQDWVSNTVSEADSLGCMTLYPAYRSFPEVFANNENHMYIPWSVDDAVAKVISIIQGSCPKTIGLASSYQDGTIQRTIDILAQKDNQGQRNSLNYRDYVTLNKY